MFHACRHGQVRAVKNRTLARVGQVMDAVVVALAARGQENCRSHPVTLEKDRIVQVVDAAANPHGIARGHHLVRLVERRKGLVLCARRTVATVGRHVIHGTERLCRSQGKRKRESEPLVHKHLEYMLSIYSIF